MPDGRYQASDGEWYTVGQPPAEGWWLGADGIWRPPDAPLPTQAPASSGIRIGPVLVFAAAGTVLALVVGVFAFAAAVWKGSDGHIDAVVCDAYWSLVAKADVGVATESDFAAFRFAAEAYGLDTEIGRAARQLTDPSSRADVEEAMEILSKECS